MIAVISDIHSNASALDSVLRDIRSRRVEEIYCLGDCVGYNAFPAETLETMRREGIVSTKGNHDMMATGELPVERCGRNGRVAIDWTRSVLSSRDAEFLCALPRKRRAGGILMIHSRLGDPVGYMIGGRDFLDEYRTIQAKEMAVTICFTGHTHKPLLMEVEGDEVRSLKPSRATLDPSRFYFINPGSVGHPRSSDYRASYVLFEPVARRVQWVRVPYDVETTRAENLRHGLYTDLGPGVAQYAWQKFTERCKSVLRRKS